MRSVKLKWKECPHLGEWGLLVDGISDYEYSVIVNEGYMIAHDLIEHQNGIASIGSIGDELEAMGGFWVTRGSLGDVQRGLYSSMSGDTALANALTDLLESYLNQPNRDCFGAKVPRTRPLSDSDEEEMIGQALDRAVANAKHLHDVDYKLVNDYKAGAIHFLRAGYRKCMRRFDNNMLYANNQFYAIAQAVDEVLGQHKDDLFGYTELRLRYGKGDAECYLIEDYWDQAA